MSQKKKGRILDFLLERGLSDEYSEAAAGDLLEIYRVRRADHPIAARLWLWTQILASLYALFHKNLYGSAAMFKNYFLMAFRNLKKHKTYALINVFGLALGLSAFILILLYLQFELSFDRFHANADRLFRVGVRSIQEGDFRNDSHVYTPPMGPDMKKDMPEVDEFVRLSTLRPAYLNVDNEVFKETRVRYASSSMFQVFSFKLESGDPQRALDDPFSVVLSEQAAGRIFGSVDPMGQTIQIGTDNVYRVTGVAQDPPANSTIQFDVLISFATLYSLPNMYLDWNGGNQYITYVLLGPNATQESVEAKFPAFLWTYINETIAPYGWKNEAYLQPLPKIHFHFDQASRTALTNFFTFIAVAVFILLIACINFINLTTARAARRAREVGMRKVIGAHRSNLVRQFLGESLLMTSLAFLTGIVFAWLLAPTYSQLLDKEMSLLGLFNPISLLGLLGLILIVGLASGIYPAFYLSSFQPVKTLKGQLASGGGKRRFRNALVVFQFAVSVALIVSTLLIRDQLAFMKRMDLGYDKENMVVFPLAEQSLRTKTEELRSELLAVPGVIQAAASSDVPYGGFTSNGYIPEGYTQSLMFHALVIDEHFLDTYGIEVVKGRNFSPDFASDRMAYLMNEVLARQLTWDDPIGKTIYRNEQKKVIGVVRDFKFANLHQELAPLLISYAPNSSQLYAMSVKISGRDIRGTLDSIEAVYKTFSPGIPFEYFFLDDAFDRLYKSEERFERIFQYFSLLAIAIALLGLFSLSAYTAQQKAKEIGIRKVLGASTSSILGLFSREMLTLIVAANLIAAPIAIYVIHKWLSTFAFRMSIGVGAFVLAFVGSLAAAFLTISYQSLKAAVKKPVDELRSE
ncbi:MAG: ABC transporter permease [Candidatus Aminicenantaceae bacterium]